ncbi:hypothetical protein HXA34_16620 [Salipaludibacillus agaradhaerens]|nr:hypothetical protein [Salipaludibacillus agaradhaerens]MCR6107917.1 hypothetical protein [Salipaludibacillus agaradhaerens]MCR6119943.1 hypothetical protein [Salipaludibacillus agaradhaerens]
MNKVISSSIILSMLAFSMFTSSWGNAEIGQVYSISTDNIFEIQGKADIV